MSRRIHKDALQVGDRLAICDRRGFLLDNAVIAQREELPDVGVVKYTLTMFGQPMSEDETYEVLN